MDTTNLIRRTIQMDLPLPTRVDKPNFINTDYLNEISAGNRDFITVFLKTFKEEARKSLIQLNNCFTNNNFLILEKTAHAMKPCGVYVGSSSLTLLVGMLERAAQNLDQMEIGKLIPQVQHLTENILKEIDEYLN